MGERWTDETARNLVYGWMEHLGYTPDQIALSDRSRPHTQACELTEHGWLCIDENEQSLHPYHDAADEIAAQVFFMLERLADAGLLVEPGSETREEWGIEEFRPNLGTWREA